MRTFLVTGGAGFIGSHIAEALVQRGRPRPRDRQPEHRAPGEPGADPRPDRVHPGRRRRCGLDGPCRRRSRLHLPRGGLGLGAAEHRGPAGLERRLRDRHGRRAGRRSACRRAAAWSTRAPAPSTATSPPAPSARPTCRRRSRPTVLPSWPGSTTAGPSPPPTAWKPCACGTSTSSGRGRTPTAPIRR